MEKGNWAEIYIFLVEPAIEYNKFLLTYKHPGLQVGNISGEESNLMLRSVFVEYDLNWMGNVASRLLGGDLNDNCADTLGPN